MAAGRRTSVDTVTGCLPWRVSHIASLPEVVVLPEPWSPSSRITRGRGALSVRPPLVSPKSASSSSRTIFTTCCAGDRLLQHRLVHRLVAHAVDERLDDLEVDVGFEQGQTNLAQHAFHLLGREAHLAAKRREGLLDARAERFEHGATHREGQETPLLRRQAAPGANGYVMP